MSQQLTIKQIAALAGVSVGTVDRVLHNRGRVSGAAMSAVQAVLQKENYRYNIHTSAVAFKKTGKTFRIVVSIPSSEEGEYWDLVRKGFDKAFREYGDISIKSEYIFFDQFNSLSCREAFGRIATMNCSAVIMGTTFVEETRELCARLDGQNIPYVFVDGKVSDTHPVASYMANQESCGRLMARLMDGFTPEGKELALLLPRRVGTQMSNNSAIRLSAFKAYFAELSRARSLKEMSFTAVSPDEAHKEIRSFLRANPEVGGVAVVISTGYLVSDALKGKPRRPVIGGFDVTGGNERCIREGSLDFLINQHPERQGFNAVESLLHYLLYGVPDNTIREYQPIDIVLRENLDFWTDEV